MLKFTASPVSINFRLLNMLSVWRGCDLSRRCGFAVSNRDGIIVGKVEFDFIFRLIIQTG